MARAISSFPVPVSPMIKTVESVGATLAARARTICKTDEVPTTSSNIELLPSSSRSTMFSSARYASRRCSSWVRSSCSGTSKALPTYLFSFWFSTTGAPTQRMYRTSPSGAHDALGGIERRSVRQDLLDQVCHKLAILWVDTIQVFLHRRRCVGWLEAVNPK